MPCERECRGWGRVGSRNDCGRLRLLLASSSVAALLVGGGSSAAAACASGYSNPAGQTVGCIVVQNTPTFAGNVANSGTISAGGVGINVTNVAVFSTTNANAPGISNSGMISANATGIAVQSTPTFAGGIANSGTIAGGSNGIIILGASTFAGGITNSGTILVANSGVGIGAGISLVFVSDFAGGITNSGTISALVTGIGVVATTFVGGITNSGTILAGDFGIYAGFLISTFAGGISNTGMIYTAGKGIAVGGGTMTGSGVAVSNFSGGIANSGTISANGAGVYVASVLTFTGGISNSGMISAGGNGIFVGGGTGGSVAISTFSGGISNSGTISADGTGIRVLDVSNFISGGITNSGTIIGSVGIAITNSGPVSVFDSGLIEGTSGTAVDLRHAGAIDTFTLGPGYTIVGNVVGSGSDTFQLGGTGSGSFDLNSIGSAQQYQGFSTFNVVSGIWTVTGTSTPSWNITPGGTLLIGSNTTTITIAEDDGTFGFAQSGAYTYGNAISGSGGVEQLGPGTTTLTGANAYTGGTTIAGGTLALSGAGTLGAAGGTTTINTGGTLDLGGTTQTQAAVNLAGGTIQNGAVNGAVNSTGGTINGLGGTASVTATAGTTIVEGTNGYTGATVIAGGTFDVVGTITDTSGVDVEAGGILTGTGKVDPPTTNIGDNATLVAGNAGAPGTSMTIPGSLAFASGALYVVYLNPTTSTFTTVTGSASLNGTVQANFAPGSYGARQYTILTASGGVTGAFAALNAVNFTGTVSLSYDADDALLNVGPGYVILPQPAGGNVNQRAVVTGINNAITAGDTIPADIQTWNGLSGPAYLNALTQTDGEDSTGAERGAFDLMNAFLGLMLDPFVDGRGGSGGGSALGFAPDEQASLPPDIARAYAGALKAPPQQTTFDQRWSTWASAFGGSATTDGDPTAGSNNVTTSTYGYAGGVDYRWSPDTVLGFSLAGGGTNWNLAQGLGAGRSDAFLAGIYGVTHNGPWYLGGALAFANNWFTTNRTAMGDQLTANFQGQSYSARLEGGYRFAVPMYRHFFGVTPYAAIQAQDFHTPAYSETDLSGGGLGLAYSAMNGTDTRSELGSRFDDLTALNGMPLILRAKVAWAHDWVSNPSLNASFVSLPGSSFTVNGAPIPHDSALTSAGAQLFFTPNWSLLAKFDGEFAPGAQIYAGSGTLRYTW